MEKIALITDSTADLSRDFVEENNIRVLPFRIIYSDKEFKDNVDITPEEVYSNFKVEVPTSSLPSMMDIENLFTTLQEEGYTHVIAITLSSGLSGISNALELVSKNHPEITSCVFDSKSISEGEGYMVKEVNKLLKENKSFDEIVAMLPKIRNNIKVYFVVDTLEYLIKGGRIGKVTGTIGQLLNIKPIIGIGEDGKYFTFEKVRGRKQSIKRMLDIAKEALEKGKRLVVLDGDAKEEADKFYVNIKELIKELGKGHVERMGCISPVSGVHSGPGLIGLGIIETV